MVKGRPPTPLRLPLLVLFVAGCGFNCMRPIGDYDPPLPEYGNFDDHLLYLTGDEAGGAFYAYRCGSTDVVEYVSCCAAMDFYYSATTGALVATHYKYDSGKDGGCSSGWYGEEIVGCEPECFYASRDPHPTPERDASTICGG